MLGKCSVTELNLWPAVSLLTLWILGSKHLYLMSNQSYWLTARQVCVVCVREREREKERGGERERGGNREGKREEKKRERERETLLLKVYSLGHYPASSSVFRQACSWVNLI